MFFSRATAQNSHKKPRSIPPRNTVSCSTVPRRTAFEQLLQRLSPEIVASLTPTQMEALQSASRGIQTGNHAVDLRLILPFPGRGFYVVLLGGRERRSIKRLRAEHPRYLYSTLLGGLALLGLLAAITVPTVLWLAQVNTAGQQSAVHPTAIPWLQDQQSCEATGRIWQQEECWEREWSHLF
jgi:hypothetical protein